MNAARAVLVVDDNADICELVQEMLTSHGFEVHCAKDGTDALGVLDTNRLDLAIVDLLLPGALSGDDVAAHAVGRGVNVITMSGALASDSRGRDLRHTHVQKPFRLGNLLATVEKVLASENKQWSL
jgi:DNA-binding response OmpR family regulator